MKYAFIGSHGVGKSSATYSLASKLKFNNSEKSIKVLEESVRYINKLVGINNESFQKMAILDSIYQQELHSNNYDIIICDRIAIDYYVYGKYFNINLPDCYRDLCVQNAKEFDKLYFIRPNNDSIIDDGFRMTDIKERNNIDILFQDVLNYHEIPFEEVTTTSIFNGGINVS